MKTLLIAGALTLACLSTEACSTVSATDLTNAVNALAAAGCSGTLSNELTAQTAAGVSPGSASLKHSFTGTCDPSKVAKPATSTTAATTPAATPAATVAPTPASTTAASAASATATAK